MPAVGSQAAGPLIIEIDTSAILSPGELDLTVDAFNMAFRSTEATRERRRSTTFTSAASYDHGLARCPALEDLIGAMDASDEGEFDGIFQRFRDRCAALKSSPVHRQFPHGDLNNTA